MERKDIDHKSPEAKAAQTHAQRLIAARLGGVKAYSSEFNAVLSARQLETEIAYLVDALVLIAATLAVTATHDEEDVQAELAEMAGQPETLLARVDSLIEMLTD